MMVFHSCYVKNLARVYDKVMMRSKSLQREAFESAEASS